MKRNILYIFLHALIALCLCSCGLEEPIDTPQNSDGYIEFVARPVGFNSQMVNTKSAANEFENKIENCFFLIFDEISGNRIDFHQLDVTSSCTPNIKLNVKGLETLTACFIANVPTSFASNIGSISALESAVLDNITYASDGIIGTPAIDLDSNADTPSVQCIPMFGIQRNIAIESVSTSVQISLARLFAKVSVELTMTLNNAAQANSYYKIHSYHVHNLPTKVKLIASQSQNENGEQVYDESEWVDDDDSFIAESSKTGINHKVYNTQSLDITNAFDKIYTFDIYVPEYFLDPLSEEEAGLGDNYATEEYKPLMYDRENKFATYITIDGIYTPSLSLVTQSQPMSYTIYLGEDDCSSFSMQRNTLYKNSLIIGGTTNHKDNQDNLDHRVEISPLNLVDMHGQSSNCYLINQRGTYYLPPYKGVFKSVEEAERHRCSGTTIVIEKDNNNISITNARYDQETKCIVFDVGEIQNGNAVIILKNGNDVEWSWHLWFDSSFSVGGVGLLDVGSQQYPNGISFMDRNLGATYLGQTGLYYQSGSKNPFIGNTYVGGGINGTATWYAEEEYIKEDNTEGVRQIKSVHDPCPPGYRVPGPGDWYDSDGTEATTDALFSYLISPAVGFSYTGFNDAADGNRNKTTLKAQDDIVEATGLSIKDSETVNSTVDGPGTNTGNTEYRTRTITLKEYVNIKYNVPTTQKFGGFWTNNDGAYFKYYNYRADWSQISISNVMNFISIVECDYREYKYSVQEKREKGWIFWGSWEAISGTETSISDITTKGNPNNLNNISDIGELFWHEIDVATIGQQNTKIITGENTNNGYPVRCIVD